MCIHHFCRVQNFLAFGKHSFLAVFLSVLTHMINDIREDIHVRSGEISIKSTANLIILLLVCYVALSLKGTNFFGKNERKFLYIERVGKFSLEDY